MNMHGIFTILIYMTVTGSIATCFVLLARLALKNVPKIYSYCLWTVVLFRLLCPVSLSSPLSVMNLTPAPQVVSYGPVSTVTYGAVDAYLIPPELAVSEERDPVYVAPPGLDAPGAIPEIGGPVSQTPDAGSHQAAAEPGGDPTRYAVMIFS